MKLSKSFLIVLIILLGLSSISCGKKKDSSIVDAGATDSTDDTDIVAPSYIWSVTTFAGNPGVCANADGVGSGASFSGPTGITVDPSGNIYVSDRTHVIRKITPTGIVSTFAGTGICGSADGIGTNASFCNPEGLSSDGSGNIYVADDLNSSIRKITPSGIVTTLAVGILFPIGVSIVPNGDLIVASRGDLTVQRVTAQGVVTTIAGTSGIDGSTDGTGSAATFGFPSGISILNNGDYIVSEPNNRIIRRVTSAGVVTILAGSVGSGGHLDGEGISAKFDHPYHVATDSDGYFYVTDVETIRRVSPTGSVTTIAGSYGNPGSSDGDGISAKFMYPTGIAVSPSGDLYVTDEGTCTIRKIRK